MVIANAANGSSKRFDDVRPSARSRLLRIGPIAVATVEKPESTWPASRSVIAGAPPL